MGQPVTQDHNARGRQRGPWAFYGANMNTATVAPQEFPYFDAQARPPYRGSTGKAFIQTISQGGLFAFPGEGLEEIRPGTTATVYEYRRHNPGRIFRHRVFVPKQTTPEDQAKGGAVVVVCQVIGNELESLRYRLESLGWGIREESGRIRPQS